MPHAILEGGIDLDRVVSNLGGEVQRWKTAVIKSETSWIRSDGRAVLVEGVVVEHSRPLHPVAVISESEGEISVRLWRLAPVERTPPVQRWLMLIAADLHRLGAGAVKTTNISADLWRDLDLVAPGS